MKFLKCTIHLFIATILALLISGCGATSVITGYYIDERGQLFATYEDGSAKALGSLADALSKADITVNTDGYYVINGIVTDIQAKQPQGYHIDASGNLVVTYSDGTTENLGIFNADTTDAVKTIEISQDGFYILNGVKTALVAFENYTVTFVSGCDITVEAQVIKEGNRIKRPEVIREDYTLDGWYYNDEEWRFNSDTVLNDMTLIAKWSKLDNAQTRHTGKLCVCFGDSITGNMKAPYDYPSLLAEEIGMQVVNAGFGGCRMSKHFYSNYDAFSMYKLADAITSGDWTEQETALVGNAAPALPSYFTNRIEALKAIDWSQVDFITIFFGANDITGGMPIDNGSDKLNTATYLGALRYSLTRILTAYPHIKILLITPIYRYWINEDTDSDSKIFLDKPYTAWGDALFEVGEEFKVPVLDLYRTAGFNSITRALYYPSTDGTHPNEEGQARIADKIAAKLLSEY